VETGRASASFTIVRADRGHPVQHTALGAAGARLGWAANDAANVSEHVDGVVTDGPGF
jgi:hypothetical protein